MVRTPIAASIAALFLLTASSAFAQTGVIEPSTTTGVTATAPAPAASTSTARGGDTRTGRKLSHGDRKFLEQAAEGGLKEVEFGRLAADKATDPAVKQFGERMVRDHGDANKKLMDLAQSKSVTVPSALKRSDQRTLDKLSKASGADFDKRYMDDMVKDHKKDVKEFKKEAKSKDSDIAQFAGGTLPTLQEHLQLAQSTQQQVKSAKRSGSAANSSSGASTGAPTSASATTTPGTSASGSATTGGMNSTSTKSTASK